MTYNDHAIAIAEELDAIRDRTQKQASRRSREKLFQRDPVGLGVALEYERMGNQPVTDDLAAQAEMLGARFEHLGLTLGTVVHGVDLKSPATEAMTRFVRQTLIERKVIFFRDQHLDEDEQVAFARRFGELDAFPFGKPGRNPYILEIVHDDQHPGTENGWHTDVTWMERPSLGSVAQCTEVPPVGGDTLFADSFAACLGLPGTLRQKIEGLSGVHDYRVFLDARRPGTMSEALVDSIKARIPFGVRHPVLRTHPESGRTALYIHGGFIRHDSLHDSRSGEYLDAESSRAIVAELLAQHARPEYTCRFRWEPGSIAFWDNRSVQHYAASDYFPHRRVLRRVTISGDTPFYRPEGDEPQI